MAVAEEMQRPPPLLVAVEEEEAFVTLPSIKAQMQVHLRLSPLPLVAQPEQAQPSTATLVPPGVQVAIQHLVLYSLASVVVVVKVVLLPMPAVGVVVVVVPIRLVPLALVPFLRVAIHGTVNLAH